MATFGTIKTRVQTRIIDLPSAVLNEVGDLVNKAHKDLQRELNFKVMEAETSTLVTDVLSTEGGFADGTGDVPTDFKAMRDRPRLIDDTGNVCELGIATDRNSLQRRFGVDRVDGGVDVGRPQFILDPPTGEDRIWELYPWPDGVSDYTDGEYRIIVPYWAYLPDLVGDADTDWFTENADWYLTFKAVAEGFAVDWDEERAAFWEQKAANELKGLNDELKQARTMGFETLVPYQGARAPFLRNI